jgi:hypothetical protein
MGTEPWGEEIKAPTRTGIYIKLGGLAAHEERSEQYSRAYCVEREKKETKNSLSTEVCYRIDCATAAGQFLLSGGGDRASLCRVLSILRPGLSTTKIRHRPVPSGFVQRKPWFYCETNKVSFSLNSVTSSTDSLIWCCVAAATPYSYRVAFVLFAWMGPCDSLCVRTCGSDLLS